MRLFLAILLVSALGAGALYAQTDGFTVVTTESARRISIADHPKKIPDTTLRLRQWNARRRIARPAVRWSGRNRQFHLHAVHVCLLGDGVRAAADAEHDSRARAD